MKLPVADNGNGDIEQPTKTDGHVIGPEISQASSPLDLETRTALSEHCRETVAGNDKLAAMLVAANALVLGFSFYLALGFRPAPLILTGLGLLIGSICLLLGGRYAGRASNSRHVRAQLLRRIETNMATPAEPETDASNSPAALRLERAQQRFATTYDWLVASGEALFVAGIVCVAVFTALRG